MVKSSKKFRKKKKTAELCLKDLAKALDQCERAGLKPRFGYGMVFTRIGYVLPPVKKKDRWIVRLALPSKFEDFPADDMHLII